MTRSNKMSWFLILLGSMGFIAHFSLFPYSPINMPTDPAMWYQAFLETIKNPLQTHDIVQNLLLYLSVGFCISVIFEKQSTGKNFILSIIFTAIISFGFETAQILINERTTSLIDVGLNTISGFLGAIIAICFTKLTKEKTLQNTLKKSVWAYIGIILFFAWLVLMYWPVMPSFKWMHILEHTETVKSQLVDLKIDIIILLQELIKFGVLFAIFYTFIKKEYYLVYAIFISMVIISLYLVMKNITLSIETFLAWLWMLTIVIGRFNKKKQQSNLP